MMNNVGGAFPAEKQVDSVKLSVESLLESRIQEISLDGTETYFKPLTMSEHLCKMATKIDFLAEEEGREDQEEEKVDNVPLQNQRWPWEGIRNRLQQGLTEVSVLADVLAVAHKTSKKEGVPNDGGKYMMFAHTRRELQPFKPSMQLPAKKKGLNAAAEILFSGEKRMKSASEEISHNLEYHFQLLKLRRVWRIRRVGAKVLGDLSYRSVGSDFWHNGNFEVIKTTDEDDDNDLASGQTAALGGGIAFRPKQKQSMKVVIAPDLKGSACIKISITRKWESIEGKPTLDANSFSMDGLINNNDPDWQKTLNAAQNVVFCQEVFEMLAKQAVQLKITTTLTPFLVVGKKINASIFPDTELSIELINNPDQNELNGRPASEQRRVKVSDPSQDIFSLKLAAMTLLLEQFSKAIDMPAPHPAAAVYGLSNVQRRAPVRPYTIGQMQAISKRTSKSTLERVVEAAKHWELKRRMCEALDVLGNAIRDPYIQAQWSTMGSPTETSVRLMIQSAGYEACNRTLIDVTVGTGSIRAVPKDGRIITLSADFPCVQRYLLSQLCMHQLSTVHEVCLIEGWSIQHFSHHSGVGPRVPLGSASTLMAVSPVGNSSFSLRCWVAKGVDGSSPDDCIRYEVHAKTVRANLSDGKSRSPQRLLNSEANAVQDPKWSYLGGEWREVDWVKLHGRHFVGKIESLLAFLRWSDK